MVRSLKNWQIYQSTCKPVNRKFRQRVFIKEINTDNLCEDFGNISNDNKRQRTMTCAPTKTQWTLSLIVVWLYAGLSAFYLTTRMSPVPLQRVQV